MTKDPVCGMNVDENTSQYQSQHNGKQYSFCSEQCKNKFDQHPEQSATLLSGVLPPTAPEALPIRQCSAFETVPGKPAE